VNLTAKTVVMVVTSLQPLPFSTSLPVDMSLLFPDFISLSWSPLIAWAVLQLKNSSLVVELHTKF
jgi:hypothetical protein